VKPPSIDVPPSLNALLATCVVTNPNGHSGDLVFPLDVVMAKKVAAAFTWTVLPVEYGSSSAASVEYANIANGLTTQTAEVDVKSATPEQSLYIIIAAGAWNYPLDEQAKGLDLRLMTWSGNDKDNAVIV